MGVPTPPTTPWTQHFEDTPGRAIDISVAFDNTTRILSGITVSRDANCVFTKILIGTGADGVPDDTDKVVSVPAGSHSLTPAQLTNLANHGLTTIEDITALQITAGR